MGCTANGEHLGFETQHHLMLDVILHVVREEAAQGTQLMYKRQKTIRSRNLDLGLLKA
jgi:hypothetical protein